MFNNILYNLHCFTLYCIIVQLTCINQIMKRKIRKLNKELTLIQEVDSVKVCKQGSEKIFILPKAMTGEDFTGFRQDNRNYLKKLKTQKS